MFCSIVPRKRKSGLVPVYINVYDLTTINGYAYWFGLGVYHSGVEVHGVEYAFGAHEHPTTGIFEVEPKHCPGFTFRKSILIGRTNLAAQDLQVFMEKLSEEYAGSSYNLITKNCNHFCNDACLRLTGKPIPRWVNRLARLGLLCNCVLPVGLHETRVRQVRDVRAPDADKKKLRSQSSRFISPKSSPLPLTSSSTRSSDRNRRSRCLPPSLYLIRGSSTSSTVEA